MNQFKDSFIPSFGRTYTTCPTVFLSVTEGCSSQLCFTVLSCV